MTSHGFGISANANWDYIDIKVFEDYINKTVKLGSEWVRLSIDWAKIHTGHWDWAHYDERINMAKEKGLNVLLLIAYDTDVINENFPVRSGREAAYSQWLSETVQRYKGRVSAYEIWNEANIERFWSPPNVKEYVKLLKISYPVIKNNDSEATVVTCGLAPSDSDGVNIAPYDFIKGLYSNGARQYCDAIGLHPYCFPAFPNDNEQWSLWVIMKSIRTLMKNYGDQNKQIWLTECGAPTGSDRSVGTYGQLRTIVQIMGKINKDKLLGPAFIYSLVDDDSSSDDMEGHFGVFKDDLKEKFAAFTMRTFNEN